MSKRRDLILGCAALGALFLGIEAWLWSQPDWDQIQAQNAAEQAAEVADWKAHPRPVWQLHTVDGFGCKPARCTFAGFQSVPWGDERLTHLPANDDDVGYRSAAQCQKDAAEQNGNPSDFTLWGDDCPASLPTPPITGGPHVAA